MHSHARHENTRWSPHSTGGVRQNRMPTALPRPSARNQSHELRGKRRNQIQPRPPKSGGFRPPSTKAIGVPMWVGLCGLVVITPVASGFRMHLRFAGLPSHGWLTDAGTRARIPQLVGREKVESRRSRAASVRLGRNGAPARIGKSMRPQTSDLRPQSSLDKSSIDATFHDGGSLPGWQGPFRRHAQ